MFSASKVTSVGESVSLGQESSSGASQFEWPHGVVDFLEVGSAGEKFVNQIFNADASFLGQGRFNNLIVGDGDSGFINFHESSLVNQVFDGFEGRVTISNIRFDFFEHI